MKKFMSLVLSAAMVACMFTACGSAAEEETTNEETAAPAQEASAEAETADATAERTTFVVGFDAEYPPYGYLDTETNEYTGFDLELAQEVCDRLGWELVKTPIDWDAKDMELNSGSIDCIWNGFTINGREDDYCWSDPYVDNSQVFIVSADSGISTFDDLAGKSVLVQADSAALAALEDMPDLTASFGSFEQIADYNTALMNLEAGAADAVAIDAVVAKYYLSENDGKFAILDEQISSEQYGIGFKLGNEELRDQVQAVLYEMLDDGTFEEIATKWDQQDVICLGQ